MISPSWKGDRVLGTLSINVAVLKARPNAKKFQVVRAACNARGRWSHDQDSQ